MAIKASRGETLNYRNDSRPFSKRTEGWDTRVAKIGLAVRHPCQNCGQLLAIVQVYR